MLRATRDRDASLHIPNRTRLPRKCPSLPRRKKKKPPRARWKDRPEDSSRLMLTGFATCLRARATAASDWCQRGRSIAAPEIEQSFSGGFVLLRTSRLSKQKRFYAIRLLRCNGSKPIPQYPSTCHRLRGLRENDNMTPREGASTDKGRYSSAHRNVTSGSLSA